MLLQVVLPYFRVFELRKISKKQISVSENKVQLLKNKLQPCSVKKRKQVIA